MSYYQKNLISNPNLDIWYAKYLKYKSKYQAYLKIIENTNKNNNIIVSDYSKIKDLEQFNKINDDDIMYQDNLVCILKPDVQKGIIVWTDYFQPNGQDSLCNQGLKSGKQLHDEGVDFGRSIYHSYIFFRAPYYKNDIDYTSIETEINSSYGDNQFNRPNRAFIRVDPDKTYVFSSEIRANYSPQFRYNSQKYNNDMDYELYKSKKTLTEYLNIIDDNSKIIKEADKKYVYHLYSSKMLGFPIDGDTKYPYNNNPINMHSEILVSIPHLTPDYFVLCNN